VSGVLNASQQELPAAIDPAGPQSVNANHSSSAPNSRRRLAESRQDPRSAAGQRPRRGEREPSRECGQARPIAHTSLGPVHPSKVSKVPRRKWPGPPQRPNVSEELSSDAQPPLPGLDIPKAAAPPRPGGGGGPPVSPRRSSRLQEAEPSTTEGPAGIVSTDSLKGVAQSRPKGIVAGSPKSAGSAKPRGVSKRQRSSTTRCRAR
jgi:hypothetical protein